jgi:hypothetical protein
MLTCSGKKRFELILEEGIYLDLSPSIRALEFFNQEFFACA